MWSLKRLLRRLVGVPFLLAFACGPSSLSQQTRLADLIHQALIACKSDSQRCPAAKLCAHTALDAAEAIQIARKATAEGRDDAEATLRAATLPALAETQCAGFQGGR